MYPLSVNIDTSVFIVYVSFYFWSLLHVHIVGYWYSLLRYLAF